MLWNKNFRSFLPIKFRIILIFILAFSFLGTFSVSNTQAATIDSKDTLFNSPEIKDTRIQYIHLGQDAKIFNKSMEEIGIAEQNTVVPVIQVDENVFEIVVDFHLNMDVKEDFLLQSPVYEEISQDALDKYEASKEVVLIEEPLTFDKGVKLRSVINREASTVSLKTSITFSSHYLLEDNDIIKWNEQFYYVEPLTIENVHKDDTSNPKSTVEVETDSEITDLTEKNINGDSLAKENATAASPETKQVKLPSFKASDRYFEVIEEKVTVFDNSGGSLRAVGYLSKGQVYPRVSDYGNWHQIKFGGKYGYVWEGSTIPAVGNSIKNENTSHKNTNQTFQGIENLTVFDNTSGTLVPYGQINKGEKYPILGTMGNWLRVDFAGRVGYVYSASVAMDFKPSDKYFKVLEENVTVYDNSGGSLRAVGHLTKGEVYPRVSDYGNWHQIRFGNEYGYVWEASTTPALSSSIKNENKGQKNSDRTFVGQENLTVFDNTSGTLVPFGRINKGEKYPILGTMGNWLRVDYAGRVGYVYSASVSVEFKSGDKYFRVLEENLPVYDNSEETLRVVGYLTKGQVYPRVSDYGNWHKVKFGHQFGYVWKADTIVDSGSKIRNENNQFKNDHQTFKVLKDIEVFDNSGGELVSFARIKAGEIYPIISEYGNWYKIDFSGRIGYVYRLNKDSIQNIPIIKYTKTNYHYSLTQFLAMQMKVSPQTDLYRNSPAYASKEFIEFLSDEVHTPGYYVTATALNVREAPNSNSDTFIYGTLKKDTKVTVLREVNGWYEILYTWRNAKSQDTAKYLNPNSHSKYQHLRLDVSANISKKEINNILIGKGILEGKGQAFKEASQQYSINEAYLVSHAILETGHGTSKLGTGVPIQVADGVVTIVDPSEAQHVVYNMYGIGAIDSCPLQCGAQKAYDEGWFTPESAIIGGARFVTGSYIQEGQNTLYKMRWNPDSAEQKGYASHQYATDIGWAIKQAQLIEDIYEQLDFYSIILDIPKLAD